MLLVEKKLQINCYFRLSKYKNVIKFGIFWVHKALKTKI